MNMIQDQKHVHEAIIKLPISFDKFRCVRAGIRLWLVVVDPQRGVLPLENPRQFFHRRQALFLAEVTFRRHWVLLPK